MSLGDYRNHRDQFLRDWREGLSLIVNPQKRQVVAYAGPAADMVELLE